ncbi:MAG TPA: (2Fe-2S)-binding protein [Fimbriimonadales bacterium]|nr:(2Fe-2S)-binding protein [Fimbriimonadales bacterium]
MPGNKNRKHEISRREFLREASGVVAASTISASILSSAVCAQGAKTATQTPREGFEPEGAIEITLDVNGSSHRLHLQPRVTLLDALRERLHLTGAKKICDRGNCGGCTVFVNDKPVYACLMLAVDAQGKKITTVEALGTPDKLHPLQKEFVERDALMCGFCTPGFVMACLAAIRANPKATMEEIREACQGNICRCGTFNRVFEAAYNAAKKMA